MPVLELKDIVSNKLLTNYTQLLYSKRKWIPCEKDIHCVDPFYISQWLERLYVKRLEQKSMLILDLLSESANDWEAVLFRLLSKNFGLNINGDAFFSWSKSFPFSVVRKERNDSFRLTSIFLGQAHLLHEDYQDAYYLELKKEYKYQVNKYNLVPIPEKSFQFYGMRPMNFPTIRIVQLAAVYHKVSNLFSKIIDAGSIEKVYQIFNVDLDDYWLTHYTFSKQSHKRRKVLSNNFIDLLIINTILPLQFAYSKSRGEVFDTYFDLLREISPEKNAIVSAFHKIGIKAKNALETQSLLELKNNYCAKKRCLQCAIGLKLIKN